MFSAEKFSIFGNKAVIKQNKFGVWQFRMWISSEKKYVEKSLRTKKKTDAVDLEEELYIQLRNKYVNRKNNTLTDNEYFERELVRHWCLFGANSAMRSGEQRQLRWTDVIIDKQKDSDGDVLVRVNVREETTKLRKDRTFMCKGGNYLQRWQKLQKTYGIYKSDGLIFSTNSEDEYERYRLHRHWKQVLLLTDIDIERREKLVPYSLRHLAITNMTLSGVSFSDIAFMCGTSVKQIEHTYYHLLRKKCDKWRRHVLYVKMDKSFLRQLLANRLNFSFAFFLLFCVWQVCFNPLAVSFSLQQSFL